MDFQKGGEEEVEEEDDDEEDTDEEDGEEMDNGETHNSEKKGKKEIPLAEKSLLEAEFESRMREQFLVGGDAIFGVDYQRIDQDDKLDDLETIDRDAEDQWFGDDDDDDDDDDYNDAFVEGFEKMDEDVVAMGRLNGKDDIEVVGKNDDDDSVDYLDFVLE